MVYGAAAAGARVMTTTSSPGFSLMQEGISYIAGAQLPCLIANVQRGGPGLGNIAPSQADYFQAVKGGGHGDYRLIVLAPASPQEMLDFAILGFDLADQYRIPSLVLSDGLIGLMMESVEIPDEVKPKLVAKPWALTGAKDRQRNVVRSYWPDENGVWLNNLELQKKYNSIEEKEIRFEEYMTDDAEIIVVAYGSASRVARSVVDTLRKQNVKAGLFRPITLWPFPKKRLAELTAQVKSFIVAELSAGQMVEDVRLAVDGKKPVEFYGTLGGKIVDEEILLRRIQDSLGVKEISHG